MLRYSVGNFLSQSAEKRCRGTIWSFINFGYRKNLDKRAGGGGRKYQFFCQKFLFHNAKNFCGEPSVLCFRKIPAAKKFMDKKGVSRFSVKNFLSDLAETFRR